MSLVFCVKSKIPLFQKFSIGTKGLIEEITSEFSVPCLVIAYEQAKLVVNKNRELLVKIQVAKTSKNPKLQRSEPLLQNRK